MAAIDPKTLAKRIWYVFVTTKPTTWITAPLTDANVASNLSVMQGLSWSDEFWSVVDLKTTDDFNANLVQIDTDTHGTIYKASLPDVTWTLNWREVFTENIVSLISNYSNVAIASTPVAVSWEVISTAGNSKGDVYILSNKNGADTEVASIVVDDAGTPLVLDTNYTVNVDTDGSITWKKWYVYITFLTDTTVAQIDVDYSYTPNISDISYLNIITQELPELCLKIITYDGNVRGTWNILEMYLYDTDFTGQLVRAFQDVQRAWDIEWSTMEFKANKNGFVIINDAITV